MPPMLLALICSLPCTPSPSPQAPHGNYRRRSQRAEDYELSPIWGKDPVRVARFGTAAGSSLDERKMGLERARQIQDRLALQTRPPNMQNTMQHSIQYSIPAGSRMAPPRGTVILRARSAPF